MTAETFTDDLDARSYPDLCIEISDRYQGETGDLVRDHARAVLALRGRAAAYFASPEPDLASPLRAVCDKAEPMRPALASDVCTCQPDGGCIDYYSEDRPGDCAYCNDGAEGGSCPAVTRASQPSLLCVPVQDVLAVLDGPTGLICPAEPDTPQPEGSRFGIDFPACPQCGASAPQRISQPGAENDFYGCLSCNGTGLWPTRAMVDPASYHAGYQAGRADALAERTTP